MKMQRSILPPRESIKFIEDDEDDVNDDLDIEADVEADLNDGEQHNNAKVIESNYPLSFYRISSVCKKCLLYAFQLLMHAIAAYDNMN